MNDTPTAGLSWRSITDSPLTSMLRPVLPFLLYTLMGFVFLHLEIPTLRLFERAICDRYFRHVSPTRSGEMECKIPEIQDQLSNVVGLKLSFDALPALLTAIWYGTLADSYGRKFVLALSIMGYASMVAWNLFVCSRNSFSTSWVLLGSSFQFIGGGQRIFNSMVFTLVSDSLGHYNRTKWLFVLAFGPHCMRLVAPRIAAILMKESLYSPFIAAFSAMGVIMVLIPFLDEPPGMRRVSGYQALDADDLALTAPLNRAYGPQLPAPATDREPTYMTSMVVQSLNEKLIDIRRIFGRPSAIFCLAAYFLKRVAFTSEGFTFQYVSERFAWELRETTWLRVASASGAIAITLLVPGIGWLISKGEANSELFDLMTIRFSLMMLIVSFFGAYVATSGTWMVIVMVGCGLGEALEPAVQGLVTFVTDATENARVFTSLALSDSLAELAGGPIMARLMAIGRGPRSPSAGVCFLASTGIFLFMFFWSWSLKAKKARRSK